MKCYIVSFEISSTEVRASFVERLKAYGGYCPINKYCWAILSEQTAAEIRDNLRGVIENNDRLFVIRSGTEAAWRNSFGEKNSEWLKKNL